jgi:hypothetical protein
LKNLDPIEIPTERIMVFFTPRRADDACRHEFILNILPQRADRQPAKAVVTARSTFWYGPLLVDGSVGRIFNPSFQPRRRKRTD